MSIFKLRSRTISLDSCLAHKNLASCVIEAEVVVDRLPMLADREGRLFDRPEKIRSTIMPSRACDMNQVLQQLAQVGLIIRYEIDMARYIQIVDFVGQQPLHWHESKSVIPPPPGFDAHTDSRKRESVERLYDSDGEVPYNEIIADLNEITGQHYKASTYAYRKQMRARWQEGYRLEDFQHVHRVKFAEWQTGQFSPANAPGSMLYLSPDTLYRQSKFPKYRQQEIHVSKRPADIPV
jgi:uncharacterized phage protein (TIGR02220 family)